MTMLDSVGPGADDVAAIAPGSSAGIEDFEVLLKCVALGLLAGVESDHAVANKVLFYYLREESGFGTKQLGRGHCRLHLHVGGIQDNQVVTTTSFLF